MTKEQCDIFNSRLVGTMNHTLGIKFLPTDDESVLAEMPINENTVQYFGILHGGLHGGAALAMAETVAGAGSLAIVGDDARICGLQVSGNHVGMSAKEGKVIGKATPIHIGRTTHIWNVEVRGEDGRLLSTERVTNMILLKMKN